MSNPTYYELNTVFNDELETKEPFIKGTESNYSLFPHQEFNESGNKNDCMYQFNKPTYQISSEGYKEKVKASQEPLKYIFDFKPTDPCLMRTQQFQGMSRGGNKRPPPSLIDVEGYLQRSALIVENNKAIVSDIQKKTAPSMPNILNNTFDIPRCETDYSFETTKTQRYEFPLYNNPVYPKGVYQTNVMEAGRDTRQEVKDNYNTPTNNYNIPLPKTQMPSLPSLPAVESASEMGKTPYYMEKYPCKSSYKYHHCSDKSCPTNVSGNFKTNKPETYTQYNINTCNQ